MIAKELFEAGRIGEAAQALSSRLRDHPDDVASRTFLFELLCFQGELARARKQLSVLADAGPDTQMGAVLYFSALHAEETRHELFEKEAFPAGAAKSDVGGKVNGKPFKTISDIDPDIGPRLEVFLAGAYSWIPFEHIASIHIDPPKRLRDTLWAPAFVLAGPSFKGQDLGEVLIPVVYPFSFKHPDAEVVLGRTTAFGEDSHGREVPSGHKVLRFDEEEIPLLEVRSIEFDVVAEADQEAAPAEAQG
jgi:type VI secretion system protein ImpE